MKIINFYNCTSSYTQTYYSPEYYERMRCMSRIYDLEKFVKETELMVAKHPQRRQLNLDLINARKELKKLKVE